MMMECETESLGLLYLAAQLNVEMNWNPDMTREEYDEAVDRLLRNEFGDGWGYIREYIDISQDRYGGCWNCWGWGDTAPTDKFDFEYDCEQFDRSAYLVEKALDMATTASQAAKCEIFSCHMYYKGCYASYFKAYDENDTERLTELARRFELLSSRMRKHGFKFSCIDIFKTSMADNLEDAAWTEWVGSRDSLPRGEVQRPMPDKYLTED